MAKFKLTDNNSGMTINVSGDTAPSEEDLPQLFAHARNDAQKKLSEGSYKQNLDFSEVSKADRNKRIQKLSANAMGVRHDDIDMHTGFGKWERTKLSFLGDDQSKMEYLEKKYGGDNVNILDIDGTSKMFVRDPKSNKITMVDEMGTSLADFTADIAAAAPVTAAAIGGGIVGTMMAPGAGTAAGATGLGTVVSGALGAAASNLLVGTAQDVASEALAGQDLNIGEHAKDRLVESALMLPADVVLGGTGRLIAGGMAKRTTNKFVDDLVGNIDHIESRFQKTIRPTTAMGVGEDAAVAESKRAGFGGKPRKELEKIRDQAVDLKELIRGKRSARTVDQAFDDYIDVVKNDVDRLKGSSDASLREIGEMVEKKLANSKGVLTPKARQTRGERGRTLQSDLENAVGRKNSKGQYVSGVEKQKGDMYTGAYDAASNVRVPLQGVQDAVASALSKMNIPIDMAGDIIEQMTTRVGKDSAAVVDDLVRFHGRGTELELRQVDDWLQQLSKDAKFNSKAAAADVEVRNARELHRAVKSMRDQVIKEQAPAAAPLFKQADEFFQGKVLPTREADVSRILGREASGQFSLQSEQVIDAALSNSTSVKRVLEATGNSSEVKKTLRAAYLDQITSGSGKMNFDDDVVVALWGKSKVESLKRVNSIIKSQGAELSAKSSAELERSLTALTQNERNKAVGLFKRSVAASDELESKLRSKLFKAVANGKPIGPEDARKFAETVSGSTPSEINLFFKRMAKTSPESVDAFRQAGFDRLMDLTSAGAQKSGKATGGKTLWNPDSMATQLKKGTSNRKRWESMLGKEAVEDLDAMNFIVKAAEETAEQGAEVGARFGASASTGGIPTPYALISGSIPSWAWRKLTNIAYGSKTLRPMVRAIKASREPLDEKMYMKLLGSALGTRRGIKALADESEADPEFAAWIESRLQSQGAQ